MSGLPAVPNEAQPPLEGSRLRWYFPPAAKHLLREPLLHFLLLGFALFVIYGYLNRGRLGNEPSKQIVLSLDDLRIMETYFESLTNLTEPKVEELADSVVERRSVSPFPRCTLLLEQTSNSKVPTAIFSLAGLRHSLRTRGNLSAA